MELDAGVAASFAAAFGKGAPAAAEPPVTPAYVYDLRTVAARCSELSAAIAAAYPKSTLLYAMKANCNRHVLETVLASGFGLETVSLGEVMLALKLGAPRVLYTNNNVGDEEWEAVLALAQEHAGRIWVNCDSIQRIDDLPSGFGHCFLRVNGPVGGGHHGHVITCGPDSKFGIPHEHIPAALEAAARRGVKVIGLHQHIGSGILDAEKLRVAAGVLLSVLEANAALLPDLEYVDVGGGIGVPYKPEQTRLDLGAVAAAVAARTAAASAVLGRQLTLVMEPGRFPVAEAGYLVTRVTTLKPTPYDDRLFIGVDSGFNHLIRPTMYGSYHHITLVRGQGQGECRGKTRPVYVCGNICESGDIFTRAPAAGDENEPGARALDLCVLGGGEEAGAAMMPARGDLCVFHTAGAYGMVMASEYNTRPRPSEWVIEASGALVCVKKGKTLAALVEEALA